MRDDLRVEQISQKSQRDVPKFLTQTWNASRGHLPTDTQTNGSLSLLSWMFYPYAPNPPVTRANQLDFPQATTYGWAKWTGYLAGVGQTELRGLGIDAEPPKEAAMGQSLVAQLSQYILWLHVLNDPRHESCQARSLRRRLGLRNLKALLQIQAGLPPR